MSERIITLPEIREILPCQNGFLFLDRVQKLDEDHYVALKAVTITEPHFVGHFPAHPIMPGVLQVEAMAQLAEIAVWERLDPERKYDLYIKSISKVKFRKPNEPGDRMLIDVKVTAITTEEATIVATVTNNVGLACQGELVMGIREKISEIAMPALFNEFDKTAEIALNVDQVMQYIPHRFPFLFVDYVAKIDGCHFTGVKNGTASDPAFRIYKDGYSVLTGSVHPEIVAQAGCVHMLTNEANKGKLAYFMGIDRTDFYGAVLPGDQMRLEVEIPDTTKRFGKGEGYLYVDDKVISKTNLTFAIVDA
ncbi:MAG: 3-hydroxyacyl-ACP dehydratase FabZ [Lentisphaeria bacterium]|nr:3-hydroxyacyl-ACP dehydratase FabZ [Lentisphaeria bacterium]